MTISKVLFRADASTTVGSGHVVRCLVLADTLVKAGWQCRFSSMPETVKTLPVLGRSGIPVTTARDLDLWRNGPVDLLVVDHYGLDANFEASCRTWARRIVVIDDLANRPHDCDVLLDQTLGREEWDYRPLVPEGCRLLLGPSYALLRLQFAAARSASLARRMNPRLERIMISVGGTDPHDVAAKAVEGIALSGLPVAVDVVLGAKEPTPALEAATGKLRGPGRLLRNVSNMAAVMADADLAVGAGGVTSWERCCMGLPALVIVTADNQALIATRLTAAGAAVVLGKHFEVTASAVAAAVQRLAGDVDALRRMSEAAAAICDGMGIQRAVAAVTEAVR